jgi:O-acetyl-ADP-ribose deacetylase (regulator of RNase III)
VVTLSKGGSGKLDIIYKNVLLYGFMLKNNQIQVIHGDITRQTVDAIVNAANETLLGGGGVDGAIHSAAGKELELACRKIYEEKGGCKTGDAVITTGGNLPAKFVIHTVGPVWRGGKQQEPELLSRSYLNSLRLASENGIGTIAFPNISTGIFGYPKEQASKIAVSTVVDFLNNNKTSIENVIFVCFDQENYQHYKELVFTL